MSNNKELFLGPKFKRIYVIATSSLCLVWVLISAIMKLCGNDSLVNNDLLSGYYTAVMIVLVITGMIVDEKIRKYPGLIVTIATSVYYFSYIMMCMLQSVTTVSIILSIVFALYIGISYLVYKFIIPRIVVTKHGTPIFNTLYLIVTLTLVLFLGFIC